MATGLLGGFGEHAVLHVTLEERDLDLAPAQTLHPRTEETTALGIQ